MVDGLHIRTLGGLSIRLYGKPLRNLASRKAEALLVYLACNPRPHPREVLADLLWDDRSQRQAMANLRVILSSLRKELAPFVSITRTTAGVNPESDLWVDAGHLEKVTTAVQQQDGIASPAEAEALTQALALYDGDFLAGFFVPEASGFESWAAAERERLHRLAVDALGRLGFWQLERGDYSSAVASATRLVRIDPLAETGQRLLMQALARSGQRAEALRQYDLYARLLDEELGLEPSAEIQELYQGIWAGQAASKPAPRPGLVLQDRYRLDTQLGIGGMGVVYRAFDLRLKRAVAVKVLLESHDSDEDRERLLREAQSAARLNHPNIVAVHDAGEYGPWPFIVMELIEGQPLSHYKPSGLEEACRVALQICAALQAAHEQGIIHRDLKPENVIVASRPAERGEATHIDIKLADFGLAHAKSRTHLTQEGAFKGTAGYLAPEIILGQPASPQSDLYALGVILYELVAGRPPFTGDTPVAVISQHLHAPVVPPSAYDERVRPELDDLIFRLLSKRPEDRPSSADEIAQSLAGLGGPSMAAAGPANLDRLVRGRLIGRQEELVQATVMWQKAASGQGQFLLVSGEPGIGKSRLIQELSTVAELSGGRVLAGYSYEEAGPPYGAIAQMVSQALGDGSPFSLPTAMLADLLAISPELRLRYPEVASELDLNEPLPQSRLFDSLAAFFTALSQESPLLLVAEDVHWADSGSLAALRHLARRLRLRPLMFVAAYREAELGDRQAFQALLGDLSRGRLALQIKLNRLSRDETRAFLATLFAEEITDEFLEAIYRQTEGNPFYIEEISRALVDSGQLTHRHGRWHRPEIEQLAIPQSLRLSLQSRLHRLDEAEQHCLQLAALLGRDFAYDMLRAVSDLDQEGLITALEMAESIQLIKELPAGGRHGGLRFGFSHALIQSTLLSGLSTLRRQQLQRRVALALEESFPERLDELAPVLGRCYAEAGEGERAVPYLLQVGDTARRLYAQQEAIDAYEQALLLLQETGDQEMVARTLMKLGLTYHNDFQFERARQAYDQGFLAWQASKAVIHKEGTLPPAPHPLRLPEGYPVSLDLQRSLIDAQFFVIGQLFSGLVQLSYEDGILPDVARSWQILDEGQRYIFHLRDDVFWSDGRPVTADDFVYTYRRAVEPALSAPNARLFFDIRGAEAIRRGESVDAEKFGVHALNPHTLVIELRSPASYLLQLLATVRAFPVPRHAVEEHGPSWAELDRIVTNGPFRPVEWQNKQRLVLARNPTYHGRFTGNVEQLVLVDLADTLEILRQYDKDELDAVDMTWVTPEAQVQRQLWAEDFIPGPGSWVTFIGFNLAHEPLGDRRVRRALALAIDKEELIKNLPWPGYEPARGGLVPPGIPGHVAELGNRHDPERARRLLSEAGFPLGLGMAPLRMQTSTLFPQVSQFIRRHWRNHLGLDVQIESKPLAEHSEIVWNDPPDMWLLAWDADFPDPADFLISSDIPGHGGWRNSDFDRLIDQTQRTTDQASRLEFFRQAQEVLGAEAPIIPLFYVSSFFLVKPWVKRLPYLTLEPSMKDVIIEPH